MEIVPVKDIPKYLEDMPLDKPMEIFKVFQKMEKLCVAENGVGLSAVQVGIPWPMFLTRVNDKTSCYVDCKYTPILRDNIGSPVNKKINSIEGCLSLRQNGKLLRFKVKRHPKVRIKGQQLFWHDRPRLEPVDLTLDGVAAVVFQHEIDHQNGILISDIGKQIHISDIVKMD